MSTVAANIAAIWVRVTVEIKKPMAVAALTSSSVPTDKAAKLPFTGTPNAAADNNHSSRKLTIATTINRNVKTDLAWCIARISFLPAAAERFKDLNQREQLVAPGLGQTQFGNKKILIGIQGIEHRVNAAAISEVSQALSILQRRHQQLPLSADLPDFLVSNERIRDITEGRLNCVLVLCQRASLLGFSEFHL